ncbi:MAG: serine hydroxymethyltransferase [Planctomycetota bacterium]|nr:serine hydroxymethyltransferase [Planctomycetota bacterium]
MSADTTTTQVPALLKQVRETVAANDRWRGRTLNLIASENVLSPAARSVLDSDLLHRYAEGHPGGRYYEGTQYIDVIETEAAETMRRIFDAGWADVRPISGTVANEAVFSRIVPQGAPAIAHTVAGGGHISHARIGSLGKRTKNIFPWPTLDDDYTIDVPAARDLIAREKPAVIVLGRSLFLFPEPVADLREVCSEAGTRILYDGAHVLGLIAAGTFQDPLREGADALNGSTHKTFFGPQRGVMLSPGTDEAFCKTLDKGVFPGSSSNHHLFSLPALLVSALEVEAFGAAYARKTIANAQALGASLAKRGFHVAMADKGFTQSHQVAVDVSPYGGGKEVSARLCDQDIVCNMNLLPGEPGKNAFNPSGVRLGVQEMTRFGMGTDEMDQVADLMHAAVTNARNIHEEVGALRDRFPDVQYGFQSADLD